MNPLRIVIIEAPEHPSPGAVAKELPRFANFVICSCRPDASLSLDCDVLLLNNLPRDCHLPEQEILSFVKRGGGLVCIHDSVFPAAANSAIVAAAGIRWAYDGFGEIDDGPVMYLANAAPGDPMRRFAIRRVPENVAHPVLAGVRDFELAEEVWAQNIAADAVALMVADIGDRIRAHARFRQPVPVCLCARHGEGRLFSLMFGHYAETYSNPDVLRLLANGIHWASGQAGEIWDAFLSYASTDEKQAAEIARTARDEFGLRIFLSANELASGDAWAEEIRQALLTSRETCVLISPNSLKSEWVVTEWGAAWALGKRITPILFRCDTTQLPERLRSLQAVDLHDYRRYLEDLSGRRKHSA